MLEFLRLKQVMPVLPFCMCSQVLTFEMDITCTGSALEDRSYSPKTTKCCPGLQGIWEWVAARGFQRGIQGKEEIKDGLGRASGIHSRDLAMGSSDYPVLADERTATGVEAISILGSKVRYRNGLKLPRGIKHPGL